MRERAANLRWRFVRPAFELLYRNRALYWLASTIPFAGQWRTWQRLVLPRLRGHRVLEVGCGIGTLLVDMAEAGYTCKAVDRSPQMVSATRDRLLRHVISPDRASVQLGDVRRLPFADASFDTVVSTFPTEYIYSPEASREIARVLRPGGRVVVVLGAVLLPGRALHSPLVALQTLVYGRASISEVEPGTPPDAGPMGTLFARAGFVGRAERVRGPFWVALLYLGEKSDSQAPGGLIQ